MSTTDTERLVMHRVTKHAGHRYRTGEPLHDLEQWHVRAAWVDPRPAFVPAVADKHHGYMLDGEQIVVWVRTLPPSPERCPRCPSEAPR